MQYSKVRITIFILGGILLVLAYMAYLNEKAGMRIELEGLYLDKNFRDVGASLNECATANGIDLQLKSDLLYRANKWFSGWSCDELNNPEVIVTLNYQPHKQWQYYCKKSDGEQLVGYHANAKFEMNNIEFLDTWSNDQNRSTICKHINVIIQSVGADQKTLFHCEAGRDRTGAVAAISSALIFEQSGLGLSEPYLNIIECDYRKSESLNKNKYGRMQTFLTRVIQEYGSVSKFIADQCDLPIESIEQFALQMNPAAVRPLE